MTHGQHRGSTAMLPSLVFGESFEPLTPILIVSLCLELEMNDTQECSRNNVRVKNSL